MLQRLALALKSENKRKFFLLGIALILLMLTFFQTQPHGENNLVFPTSPPNLMGMSIAISESNYGLTGFTGYMKVHKFLIGFTHKRCRYGSCSYTQITNAIQQALHIPDVAAEGLHYSFAVDAGMTLLYQSAFRLFGYRAEAPYFLVFTVLVLSVLFYAIEFFDNILLLFVMVIFLAAYFVVANCAPLATIDLQTIFNDRFMPVYTILPTLHVFFTMLTKSPSAKWLKLLRIILVVMQSLIIGFSISARGVGQYQIMALCLLPFVFLIFIKKKKISLFPLLLFLACASGFQAAIKHSLSPVYEQVGEKAYHGFWHNFYLGLGAHPDALRRYGFNYSDIYAMKLVEKKAPEYGYTFDLPKHISTFGYHLVGTYPKDPRELMIQGERYSQILKLEYWKILRQDPIFVFMSFIYKIPIYFQVYFSESGAAQYHFNAAEFLLYPPLVLMLILALFLAFSEFIKHRFQVLLSLTYLFFFSLIAPIAVVPESYVLADSGLLFTMLLFIAALFVISLLLQKGITWTQKK